VVSRHLRPCRGDWASDAWQAVSGDVGCFFGACADRSSEHSAVMSPNQSRGHWQGGGRFQVGDAWWFGDLVGVRPFGPFAKYCPCPPKGRHLTSSRHDLFPRPRRHRGLLGLAALQACATRPAQRRDSTCDFLGPPGGVGSFARIRSPRPSGLEVTGACSAHKMAMVRSIGADHVIDLAGADFTPATTVIPESSIQAAYGPSHNSACTYS